MGKGENFSATRSELDDIIKRLDALDAKMATVLSPEKINEFTATFSKLDEVIGRLNLGKLEFVFKEASGSLDTLRSSMRDFLGMMQDFSATLQNLSADNLKK